MKNVPRDEKKKPIIKQGKIIFLIVLLLIGLGNGVASGKESQVENQEGNSNQATEKFLLNRVILEQTTVLSEEEVTQMVQEYLNQEISLFELHKIQERLSEAYISRGYINSIVVLPSQKIAQGVIHYKAIEGKVQLEIKGTENLKEYLAARIKPFIGPPFNQNAFLERLKILAQNPKLEKIQANLSETGEIGQSLLTVEVQEAPSWELRTSFDNFENPLLGDAGGEIELLNQKLGKNGNSFKLSYKRTEGLERFLGVYRHEFAPNNSSLQFSYQESDSEIVEGVLEPFDVKNEAFTVAANYNQMLLKTANRALALGLGVERRENRGTVLERRLFSDPQLTVGRIGLTYSEINPSRVIFGASTFSVGGSTAEIDPTFMSWTAQGQVIQEITSDLQIFWRLALHLSPHRLPGGERCALGGKNGDFFIFGNTVRGYGTNFVSDDNCLASTVELRNSLWQEGAFRLQVLGFVDYGQVWGSFEDVLPIRTLVSVGLGARVEWESLRMQLDVGVPLNPVPPEDTNQLHEVTLKIEGILGF